MLHVNRHHTPLKGIKVASIALAEEEKLVVKKAFVSNLSPLGFKLVFHNQNFISDSLKFHLHFYALLQKELCMYIPDMEMDLDGIVTDVRYLEDGKWEVSIEFSPSAPQYWRECLCDLWPDRETPNPL